MKNENFIILKSKKEYYNEILMPDYIDTNSFDFLKTIDKENTYFKMIYISYMPRFTNFINTFEKFFSYENIITSTYFKPIENDEAIKKLNKNISDINSEIILAKDENRIEMLENKKIEVQKLRDEIDMGFNNLINVYLISCIYSDNKDEIEQIFNKFYKECSKRGIEITSSYANHEDIFKLILPMNIDKNKGYFDGFIMDKKASASFYHYTKTSINHKKGMPLGVNISTNESFNFDLFDEKNKNFGISIVGSSGSGKSTLIKEIILKNIEEIKFLIIDAEGEYSTITKKLGGENISFKNKSNNCINFFDLDKEIIIEDNLEKELLNLNQKISDISYIISMMASGDNGLISQVTKDIILEITKDCYDEYKIYDNDISSLYENNIKKSMPTLSLWYEKLQEAFLSDSKKEDLMPYMEQYYYLNRVMKKFCKSKNGNISYFDGKSNLKLDDDIPIYNMDISNLNEKFEKPLAMNIILNFFWENIIKRNSNKKNIKRICIIFDEFYLILPYKDCREYVNIIYRRARKRNCAPIIATQRINDFLEFEDAKSVLVNSNTKFIGVHDESERNGLKEVLNINDKLANKTTTFNKGVFYVKCANKESIVNIKVLEAERLLIESNPEKIRELEEKYLKEDLLC
ncbi:DUF87 domain-containing protein [Peptostreptococcaceae bacterium AGR-M142]